MKYKITIASFIICLSSFAQVSGYMGKRFFIGYDNYFAPTLAPTSGKTEGLRFNTTNCLNVEYAVKERTNFCLSFQYFKTGVMNKTAFSYIDSNQYGGVSSLMVTYNPLPNIPMQLKSSNIAVGLKFFNRGYLAPLGKYTKVELLIFFNNLTYDKKGFTSSDYGYNTNVTVGTGEYSYKNFALTCTFGRQRILFDRLVLDMGTRIGFVPGPMFNVLYGGILSMNSTVTDEDRFKTDVANRIFRHELINFHIGIGFLAF